MPLRFRWLLWFVLAGAVLSLPASAQPPGKKFSSYPLATTVSDADLFLIDQSNGNGTYTTKTVKRPAVFGGHVFYLSQLSGVYGDASLSDPTVGHDDSAAVQAAINAAPAYSTFVVNGVFRLGNIKLRSGDTVTGNTGSYNPVAGTFPATGIMQAPNTVCVFRNANWISNYNGGTPVYDFSTVVDRDIMIANLFINGNRGTCGVNNACGGSAAKASINDADQWANPSQLRISPILFYGVRNMCMANVFIYDPGRVGITLGTVDGALLENTTIFDPATYAGTAAPQVADGIYITGNNRGITIEGVYGYVSNSMLSVYSDDVYTTSAYNPIKYSGPITDIAVRRWRQSANNTSLPCCEFSSGSAVSTSLIDRVTFRDIVWQCGNVFFRSYGGNGTPSGSLGRFTFENVFIQRTSAFQSSFVRLGSIFQEVTARDIHQIVAGAEPILAIFDITNNNSVDILNLDRLFIDDTSSGSSITSTGVISYGNSTLLNSLRMSNICWLRSQAATGDGAVLQASADNIGSVEICNVRVNNLRYLINLAANRTIANVTTNGITHTNAGGNASIKVNAGTGAITRLRSAASNTALLTSGTITSKKTDSTEDS